MRVISTGTGFRIRAEPVHLTDSPELRTARTIDGHLFTTLGGKAVDANSGNNPSPCGTSGWRGVVGHSGVAAGRRANAPAGTRRSGRCPSEARMPSARRSSRCGRHAGCRCRPSTRYPVRRDVSPPLAPRGGGKQQEHAGQWGSSNHKVFVSGLKNLKIAIIRQLLSSVTVHGCVSDAIRAYIPAPRRNACFATSRAAASRRLSLRRIPPRPDNCSNAPNSSSGSKTRATRSAQYPRRSVMASACGSGITA